MWLHNVTQADLHVHSRYTTHVHRICRTDSWCSGVDDHQAKIGVKIVNRSLPFVQQGSVVAVCGVRMSWRSHLHPDVSSDGGRTELRHGPPPRAAVAQTLLTR